MIEMPFGLWTRMGHILDKGPDPQWEGATLRPIVKYRDLLPWAVQKQLNQLRCHSGCGLKWVHGSTIRWGAYWRIQLNGPCVVAMRPFCQITLMTCWTVRRRITDVNLESSHGTTRCKEEILSCIELTEEHWHIASEQATIFRQLYTDHIIHPTSGRHWRAAATLKVA